jgi:hypothetical protein
VAARDAAEDMVMGRRRTYRRLLLESESFAGEASIQLEVDYN